MQLSVIIVNYNVKYFLEQAIISAQNALKNIDGEIWVVDNASVDGSVEIVREKFTEVKLIANTQNVGFSKANNQAILKSSGKYVLLLNPDTVVEEDTFQKVIRFMDEHPDAGGLGVKMIDGTGKFLPESKRGLPTPLVAFYKIFGLSAIFPKSKLFGRYHLGYLDKDQVHEVEVLSGAFMLMRKEALDKVGLLDEDYFMYGEDIDLSYRIIKGGYKNYYFPNTTIIHYKGESTKKSSVNYVFVFYRAMVIFAKKHFSSSQAGLFSFLINIAIYIRASFAIIARFIKASLPVLLDSICIYLLAWWLKSYWEKTMIYEGGGSYPSTFMNYVVPAYIIVWILGIFLSGGYDKPLKLSKLVRGIFSGTVLILIVYALLPESFRYSRALILLNSMGAAVVLVSTRLILSALHVKGFELDNNRKKRIILLGSQAEVQRVQGMLSLTGMGSNVIGYLGNEVWTTKDKTRLGSYDQLMDICSIYQIDEVIFCAKDISSAEIINYMAELEQMDLEYKIAPPESLFIIGSNSIHSNGELYTVDINTISRPANRRNKRFFDILSSLLLIVLSPLLLFIVPKWPLMLRNSLQVLVGSKTWIGFSPELRKIKHFSILRPGVLHPLDGIDSKGFDENTIVNLNMLYAKDYSIYADARLFLKALRKLGRN